MDQAGADSRGVYKWISHRGHGKSASRESCDLYSPGIMQLPDFATLKVIARRVMSYFER
jgi:hypothetical protein